MGLHFPVLKMKDIKPCISKKLKKGLRSTDIPSEKNVIAVSLHRILSTDQYDAGLELACGRKWAQFSFPLSAKLTASCYMAPWGRAVLVSFYQITAVMLRRE
jgi:hypothetical protein